MTYNELIEEKRALDNNIRALNDFVKSDHWHHLSDAEHELIRAQLIPMTLYGKILSRRIAAMEHRPEGDPVEINQPPPDQAA